MFRLFLLTAIFTLVYGDVLRQRVPLLDGRIVGGENTDIALCPYQVSVRLRGSHVCGGSILNSLVVVTAAHCIDRVPASFYSIQHGVTNVGGLNNLIIAADTLKHENYDSNTIDYDIALIFLRSEIPLNTNSWPITVASNEPAAGTLAVASGWGTLTEGGSTPWILQSVGVVIFDRSECRDQYENVNDITQQMICAGVSGGGKDACQGDSGGPLAANGELVGIVSWGVGCARPEYLGVYCNVARLFPWINEKLSNFSGTFVR